MKAAQEQAEFRIGDLVKRWAPLSRKTVLRHIAQFDLKPCRAEGMRPVFARADLLAMEARRKAAVDARYSLTPAPAKRIISLGEAKLIASKKRRAS